MSQSITPFLMFEGNAEEAMTFYVSLFPGAEVLSVTRWGSEMGDHAGKIMVATFALGRQQIMCSDSPVRHGFTFTPSSSLFVQCDSMDELRRLFAALSERGQVLMALDDHGFSQQFGWVNDRFGVSWQLNLP